MRMINVANIIYLLYYVHCVKSQKNYFEPEFPHIYNALLQPAIHAPPPLERQRLPPPILRQAEITQSNVDLVSPSALPEQISSVGVETNNFPIQNNLAFPVETPSAGFNYPGLETLQSAQTGSNKFPEALHVSPEDILANVLNSMEREIESGSVQQNMLPGYHSASENDAISRSLTTRESKKQMVDSLTQELKTLEKAFAKPRSIEKLQEEEEDEEDEETESGSLLNNINSETPEPGQIEDSLIESINGIGKTSEITHKKKNELISNQPLELDKDSSSIIIPKKKKSRVSPKKNAYQEEEKLSPIEKRDNKVSLEMKTQDLIEFKKPHKNYAPIIELTSVNGPGEITHQKKDEPVRPLFPTFPIDPSHGNRTTVTPTVKKPVISVFPGSNIPILSKDKLSHFPELRLIASAGFSSTAAGTRASFLFPLSVMVPTNSVFRTVALIDMTNTNQPRVTFPNLNEELASKLSLLQSVKDSKRISDIHEVRMSIAKINGLPKFPILRIPGFRFPIGIAIQETTPSESDALLGSIEHAIPELRNYVKIPILTARQYSLLNTMCHDRTNQLETVEILVGNIKIPGIVIPELLSNPETSSDSPLPAVTLANLELIYRNEKLNLTSPSTMRFEEHMHGYHPYMKWRWKQKRSADIPKLLSNENKMTDEFSSDRAAQNAEEEEAGDTKNVTKATMDENIEHLLEQAIDKGANQIVEYETKENDVSSLTAVASIRLKKWWYIGQCIRNYTLSCPNSWEESTKDNTCFPPSDYKGTCSPTPLKKATDLTKELFAWSCEAEWPCINSPAYNMSAPCPMNWANYGDTLCIAPNDYIGHCSPAMSFAGFTPEAKVHWGAVCKVEWPLDLSSWNISSHLSHMGTISSLHPLQSVFTSSTTNNGAVDPSSGQIVSTPYY